MRHIVLHTDDVPVTIRQGERRMTTDRREGWRGGRRDADWVVRPAGALARLEAERRSPLGWARRVATLHLW